MHAICHVISFHCRLLASPESVVLVLMAAAHTCHVIVSISRASRVCSAVLCAVVTSSFFIPASNVWNVSICRPCYFRCPSIASVRLSGCPCLVVCLFFARLAGCLVFRVADRLLCVVPPLSCISPVISHVCWCVLTCKCVQWSYPLVCVVVISSTAPPPLHHLHPPPDCRNVCHP